MAIIRDLQDRMAVWRAYNFPTHTSDEQLMGMMEELGELAHAHIKGMQGIRHSHDEIYQKKEDAIGDLFIYATGYCTREGIDMEQAIYRAWNEVKERDWRKYPQTGRPPDGE